jgi:uncharacterized protein
VTSQEDLVAALCDPSLYPHRPERVDHLQTHLSHVFVAPPFAYKLKKAVRFSFADFSTPERRRAACLEEVRLNRRLCAPLYLGVLPVSRHPGSTFALGPSIDGAQAPAPKTVEHVVWMRALPADGMGRTALAGGRITPSLLGGFAHTLARFHATAPTEPADRADAWLEETERRWSSVLDDSRPMVARLLRAVDHEILSDFGPTFVRRHASLLAARLRAGRVCEGHGDLHLGNLCLLERPLPPLAGSPAVPAGLYAFDCIEFSRDLRVNDVASEVAFLAMDLDAEQRSDLARLLVREYAAAAGDADLHIVLPLFASHRAVVRGMVHGLAVEEPELGAAERRTAESRARAHFALATRYAWQAAGPAVIACAGLSGSGKSTVAVALARATGFHLLSSDEMRKRRAGLDPKARSPAGTSAELYTEAARHATYEALAMAAQERLTNGQCVIVDATFNRAADRARLESAARRAGCPLVFLECVTDDETARMRIADRATGPRTDEETPAMSDADWAVRAMQSRERDPFDGREPHLELDTVGDRDAVNERALGLLWQWRRMHAVHAATQISLPPVS